MFKLWLQNAHTAEKEKGRKLNLSNITTRMKRHVRHKLKDEKPTIWIGKDGLTPQISVEIEKQLNKNKMLKVRILTSALQQETAKAIATKAAEDAEAALVEVRGHVFILYRRHKKQPP
jgi:RNA-binding protein